MRRDEILKELQMTYYELQSYLVEKYGAAEYDYFATAECRSKNKKISRTAEGLYCHHMDEDKGANLADPSTARGQPIEWQKKERLVYCNAIEHLILHIKIAVLRQKKMLHEPHDVHSFFTTGGIYMICLDINELFAAKESDLGWRKASFETIKENYADYILLLQSLIVYIDSCYCADKQGRFLQVGSKVHFKDCDCEILKITKKKDKMLLKMPSGEEKMFYTSFALSQLKYEDYIYMVISKIAATHNGFCDDVYSDLQNCTEKETVMKFAEILKVDYIGYGFSQFAHMELTADFDAENADEYISNAFPVYCNQDCDLRNKIPKFWKGSNVPLEAKDKFYIIRIETAFTVKEGYQPFVRYKKTDRMRKDTLSREINSENNFLNRNGTILSTSDVYDPRTNKYYSKYINYDGKVVDATVTLTLSREDFEAFKKCYNVSCLKILDGCYFVTTKQ